MLKCIGKQVKSNLRSGTVMCHDDITFFLKELKE